MRIGREKRCVNIIVAQKAKNTTCQIGEFLSQNLPIWQVFGVFKAMRSRNLEVGGWGKSFRGVQDAQTR
jgi:hypothetical protein